MVASSQIPIEIDKSIRKQAIWHVLSTEQSNTTIQWQDCTESFVGAWGAKLLVMLVYICDIIGVGLSALQHISLGFAIGIFCIVGDIFQWTLITMGSSRIQIG